MLFSIYNNVIDNTQIGQVSVEELVEMFKNNKHQNIDRLRTLTDVYVASPDKGIKKALGGLKTSMPYVTPAGVFGAERKNNLIETYSGVVQIDIDIKHPKGAELVPAVKDVVSKLPFVGMCAVSPSGVGVKAFAMTNNNDVGYHVQCVAQINKIVEAAIVDVVSVISEELPIDKIIDDCAKAISQPMLLTYDPDTYYNPDYTVYDFVPVDGWTDEKPKTKKSSKPGRSVKTFTVAAVSNLSIEEQTKFVNAYMTKAKYPHQTKYAQKLIGYCNRMGIDAEVLRDFMMSIGWTDADDLNRIDSMYRTYAHEHGTGITKEVEVDEIIPSTPTNTILIPKGKFLSEILDGRTLTKSTHVVAPTGAGKTNLNFGSDKQIWVFPTTALCQQFLGNKNAWTVWGGAPFPEGCRDLIITTYDSFGRVAKEVDVSEYIVVLDEVHNFVTASKEDYKLIAMRTTLEWLPKAKRVITLTATPIPHRISVFEEYETIILTKEDQFKRTVRLLSSEESRTADVVKLIKERGNFALVFLQTTERNVLTRWETRLTENGMNMVKINSQQKASDEFVELVSKRNVDAGSVYVSTSVIAEGVSIETELDTVDVYIMEGQHHTLIEQMARRFRNIKELNVFVLTNGVVGELTIDELEIAAADKREKFNQLAEIIIDGFEDSGLVLDDVKNNKGSVPVFENKNGEWCVDELLIENLIFENERELLRSNPHLTVELLNKKYGYEIVDVITMSESATMVNLPETPKEIEEVAKNIAIGKMFGQRFEEPTDPEFRDALKKYSRFVSKIAKGLPGITKLGAKQLTEIFNAFDVWNDKRSDRFITYVKNLNTGSDVRQKYRDLVVKFCVGRPLTNAQLIGYGSILFEHEMVNASEREKIDFVMSVLMAHDKKRGKIKSVKQVSKIKSVVSGDDVEVVGMEVEEVKVWTNTDVFTPNQERLSFENALASLNIFGYSQKAQKDARLVILSDDDQFRNEVMSIPGFTF